MKPSSSPSAFANRLTSTALAVLALAGCNKAEPSLVTPDASDAALPEPIDPSVESQRVELGKIVRIDVYAEGVRQRVFELGIEGDGIKGTPLEGDTLDVDLSAVPEIRLPLALELPIGTYRANVELANCGERDFNFRVGPKPKKPDNPVSSGIMHLDHQFVIVEVDCNSD